LPSVRLLVWLLVWLLDGFERQLPEVSFWVRFCWIGIVKQTAENANSREIDKGIEE
jgi:hypothetical protein